MTTGGMLIPEDWEPALLQAARERADVVFGMGVLIGDTHPPEVEITRRMRMSWFVMALRERLALKLAPWMQYGGDDD